MSQNLITKTNDSRNQPIKCVVQNRKIEKRKLYVYDNSHQHLER